jgi:hypothetical protein
LFGLNTLGGALVLDTKNGADNPGLSVTAQGGSFNRRNVAAEAGGTLANKSIDWFIAGNYDKQDGYRWYTNTEVKQAYGKLRWHGASANAELGAVWADSSLNGTQSLPLSMLGTPQVAYTWPDNVSNNQIIVNLKADARLASNVKISGNVYYRRSKAHSSNSNASNDDGCEGGNPATAQQMPPMARRSTSIRSILIPPTAPNMPISAPIPAHYRSIIIRTTSTPRWSIPMCINAPSAAMA